MQFAQDGYKVGGVDVSELKTQFGTPLYVYDGEKII
jgi:diaminopimelate decarboxylase